MQITPTSQRDFYVKAVEALVSFETDAKGKVTRMVVRQD